jgi:L-threonylcarbamoyladenylate synthase
MQTKTLKIDKNKPEEDIIKEAAGVIKNGGIVAFPTETVYGLAASYSDRGAKERIYRIKKRPKDKPLTVQLFDASRISEYVYEVPRLAELLIKKFWPGPLTLIFKSKEDDKIGIRIPDNPVALGLIRASGGPIVAPSANISGNPPATTAEQVTSELGGLVDMILDSGPTDLGEESTVLDVSSFPFKVLREGAIARSCLADAGRDFIA